MIDLWWGNNPTTAGPYPPKKQVASLAAFNETYNAYDGSVHENDGSRTIIRPNGNRKVTDKHQIKLNFGDDPKAAYSTGTPQTVPSAHAHSIHSQMPEYLINAQAEKPDLTTLKLNKFDGLYHAADGSKWMADQDNEVGGVNSWFARPAMEQRDSVPYCTSYECKIRSSADSEPVKETDWKLEPNSKDMNRYRSMQQRESVPYCTSYECKTGSPASKPDWEFDPKSEFKQRYVPGSLYQSIPDCNSYDCRKDPAFDPYVVPQGEDSNSEYVDRLRQN